MTPDIQTVRVKHGDFSEVRTTLSVVWIAGNRKLAVDTWQQFFEEHPLEDWNLTTEADVGTITLIATRKNPA